MNKKESKKLSVSNCKKESKETIEARKELHKLLNKFKNDTELQAIIKAHYGKNVSVMTYDYGCLQFSPNSMRNIVGGDKLTYNEYLALQIQSYGKVRTSFQQCYFECALSFCGQIEKKTKDNVCFKRILISGMYSDGIMFDGKEDHVWMSLKGFEKYQVGDCVSFGAEVYRYIKTNNGKVLDYGLRNPIEIKIIDEYDLPTDAELQKQAFDLIVCEACYLNEHCNKNYCILNTAQKSRTRKGNKK